MQLFPLCDEDYYSSFGYSDVSLSHLLRFSLLLSFDVSAVIFASLFFTIIYQIELEDNHYIITHLFYFFV